MEEVYEDNTKKRKSSNIYNLFQGFTEDLSLKNTKSIEVSGILFGTLKGDQIADLIALTDLSNNVFNFKTIKNSK
jgi:hypothetical protein